MGPLTWQLCDLNQTVLATLDDRRAGAKVSISRNEARTAECPISWEDPAAEFATCADSVLKCTVEGWSEPLFVGRVFIPEGAQAADSEQLMIHAIDPMGHLERQHYISKITYNTNGEWGAGSIFQWDPFTLLVYPFTITFGPYFAATDDSAMMWSLIQGVGGHGIVSGTLANAADRNLEYAPAKEIGSAVKEIAGLDGGPDFELAPVSATDGTLAEFNTFYPRQGSDLTASVVFEFAHGGESAKDFKSAPEPPVNRVYAIGGPSNYAASHDTDLDPSAFLTIAVRAWHQDSIDQYGVFEAVEENGEITDANYLLYKARGLLSPEPMDFFDFTPSAASQEAGSGLVFGPDDDFWMGDTIACEAHLPWQADGVTVTKEGRVDEAVLTERDNGEVDIDLTCSPEIDLTGVSSETLYMQTITGIP